MLDLLLKNATVYDGNGGEPFQADVGISGDRIARIHRIPESQAARVLDATGLAVSPGFVDIHSHSDHYIMIDPLAESKVLQGVTTEVGGNCGYSPAPLSDEVRKDRREAYKRQFDLDIDWSTTAEFLDRMEKSGTGVNYAQLIGHNTVRSSVLGTADVQPDETGLRRMREAIRDGMRQGAFGMSTGFVYSPSCFAKTPELVDLYKTVREENGVFTAHIRSEGPRLLEGIEEAIAIARESGAPLQLSHLKTAGEENWHKLGRALEMIESAIDEGIPLRCDRYPYTASNTGLMAVLPDWVFDGGRIGVVNALRDSARREKIREEILRNHPKPEYWETVMISQVVTEKNRDLEGKNVVEAAEHRRKGVFDLVFDLLIEENTDVEAIYFCMNEKNMESILKKPYVMIGSDSGARSVRGPLGIGRPHPRGFGTYPKFIREFVREKKLLSLPEAIRKMTSDPCRAIGIPERGLVREGYFADLAVFDPAVIADTATYQNPLSYPVGIEWVIINGRIAAERGRHTGSLLGRVLRKNR